MKIQVLEQKVRKNCLVGRYNCTTVETGKLCSDDSLVGVKFLRVFSALFYLMVERYVLVRWCVHFPVDCEFTWA